MTKPIRVLCVFSELNRGGAETMCMNLYRNIDRTKIQFDFVKHTQKKCEYEDEILRLGGKIYTAPKYIVINQIAYERWWKKHFENHPEHQIVHGHYYTIADVYFKIAHQYGRKTIAHSHSEMRFDLPNRNKIKDFLVKKHCARLEENSDLCLACSKAAGDWIFKDYTILRNGIDISKFKYNEEYRKEIRSKYDINDEFVVGIVARISPPKNPYGVIDVFREYHKLNANSKLMWVGGDFMNGIIQEYVSENGLSNDVIFVGSVDEVYKYYQAFDTFILPSFYEGLPVSVVESQAAGLQTIISDNVTNEVVLSDLCKSISLSSINNWLLSIPKERYKRTDVSEAIMKSGYSISNSATLISKIYKEIGL